MGFLKFLKRDKRKEFGMDEMDAPPLPPDMKGMDFDEPMPEIPDIGDMPEMDMPKDWPKAQEIEKPEENEKFEIPRPIPDFPIESKLPEPPKFGSPRPIRGISRESGMFAEPKFDFQPKPQQERQDYEESAEPGPVRDYAQKAEKEAVREEKALISHKDASGKTYIRMDRFRSILMDINDVKNDIKNASASLEKMQGIDKNKEIEFEKWKANMNDLQKKIIFVDKTLFK